MVCATAKIYLTQHRFPMTFQIRIPGRVKTPSDCDSIVDQEQGPVIRRPIDAFRSFKSFDDQLEAVPHVFSEGAQTAPQPLTYSSRRPNVHPRADRDMRLSRARHTLVGLICCGCACVHVSVLGRVRLSMCSRECLCVVCRCIPSQPLLFRRGV